MGRYGWRGLVWSAAAAEPARRQAWALWQARVWHSPCWVSPAPPEAPLRGAWLPPAKARTRLGREHDLIVFDGVSATDGLDADAFGALSGTLCAGGLLVLLTPPSVGAGAGRYMARLLERLSQATGIARWTPGSPPQLPELPAEPPRREAPDGDPDCLTPDQAEAVRRLVGLRRRRPLVLTADRGRGKSAALGIACARLLEASQQQIGVTAPRPEAVAALFARLEALRPLGRREGNRFVDAQGGGVEFLAPDELSARVERGEAGGAGTWLLVDEAAAIPAALLGHWLEAFPRIAFATTVHGYEGSGRGFALRFRQRLERQAPDWREFHLVTPVRWAEGDPLERLVDELLLLDAEPPPPMVASALETVSWERPALVADEDALREIFGLLVQAHYRTTPADLQRLLDAPGLGITTLAAGGHVQAVAVCADEGGFTPELAERVARGERRLPGHLLAQSLAAHAGSREALAARLRRVQRIAVHPQRRREGLGRRLLEQEREAARRAGVDLLGASFGAEPGLLAFWQALGFRTVRLGLSRETSTGEHAVMVVAPLGPAGEALAETLSARFQRLLPALLAFELADLDPQVALALLAEGPRPAPDAVERCDIADVAHGRREPALARPALQGLVRRAATAGCREPDLAWLAAWAFQGRDIAWLAARCGAGGRRQAMERLRGVVARLQEGDSACPGRAFPGASGPVR
ncbi:tRNA(Met) cytidine acetyltransferase [Halomonas sp. MCCC 1A17488]|uniref:tRNA(Met) cytidine acetyltransferase TmcA n=1 Tax=unclassified Halomonas TaxID=2609666 RepID=UPI0018D26D7A|nr:MULTISPECIES: GNAT family N-acetyltransferase [unclassified Halomonas]MCE8018351.1 tRNA(Met) cytidine acetyltransferase [Halomonas sp. MCCC 1A17488]MCG3241684.1 tRNA(Met) cytidine acetyltransferase [Halomonas sp. MCCC 1A17488]QPP49285.1 tRNA(Met) cytidine acetyltransferase [Halomonas sp. SS10-MC5]